MESLPTPQAGVEQPQNKVYSNSCRTPCRCPYTCLWFQKTQTDNFEALLVLIAEYRQLDWEGEVVVGLESVGTWKQEYSDEVDTPGHDGGLRSDISLVQ